MKIEKVVIIVKIFENEVDYILPRIREIIENLGIKDEECISIVHDRKLIEKIGKLTKK
jgi:hypothetical protein